MGHDTKSPRRFVVASIAVVALLVSGLSVSSASADPSRTDRAFQGASFAHAPSTAPVGTAVRLLPAGLAILLEAGAAWLLATFVLSLLISRRRRVGDVGDRWRSLLLRAPPMLMQPQSSVHQLCGQLPAHQS
jgi:hypothetical protein